MQTYSYQVLRYIHDRATGEFVNVGIIIAFPEQHTLTLHAKFTPRFQRLSAFFGPHEVDGKGITQLLKKLENRVQDWNNAQKLTHADSLGAITEQLLRPDTSSLVFSEVATALAADAESSLNYLYDRFVSRYMAESF